MQKHFNIEYDDIESPTDRSNSEEEMSKLTESGWELFSTALEFSGTHPYRLVCVFTRDAKLANLE